MTLIQERNQAIIAYFKDGNFPTRKTFNYKRCSAPRYYITEKQAERHVYLYMRKIFFRSDEKRRMQKELYEQYSLLISKHPTLSKADIFTKLVMSPASEYFVSYNVLQRLFWQARKSNINLKNSK